MSEENVEVVRRWFARLSAGDPAPDLCDPGIEVRNWPESPVPDPYHGHDGLRKWWREVNDPDIGFEIKMFELEDVVGIDEERVLTAQRATGRGRTSGFEIDQRWGAIIGVHDGKVGSAVGYPTVEAAREAAGLAESDT